MSEKTLFLAWQDEAGSRSWFPIGRLDVDAARPLFRFRYIRGAEKAHHQTGFPPLPDFPDFSRDYRSSELFSLFRNRVISRGRPDFTEYVRHLDLSESADPIEILSVGEGTRATDTLQVFPKLERQEGDTFRCRFFLHGWRYMSQSAQQRLEMLQPGEMLHVALELTNQVTGYAIQLQATDYVVIGWAPRYLVADFARAIAGLRGGYTAEVVRVNPAPAPSKQRLLVELQGPWPDEEPMTTGEFETLVA